MASSFLERLRSGPPITADGGMGVLVSSAVPRLRCPEEANVRAPESVVDLHLGFIRAGAELIETNTFGANRRKLATYFLEQELEQINSAGVKLARDAREVSGRDVYIGGSIGPLGDVGDAEDERFAAFAEQAGILEGRGVDLFMVETFYDLAELEQAIAAVRSVSSLPIVALLTFDEDAETLAGVSAQAAAEHLRRLDVAAIGANHGAGLQAALTALELMGGDGPPLAALPNLGLASLAGGTGHLPARDAGVLRRVRGPGAQPRRRDRRGLLRDDTDRDRLHPRRPRRGACPVGSARGRRADAGGRRDDAGAQGDCARPRSPRGAIRGLGADRPAARRRLHGPARDGGLRSASRARPATSTSTTTRRRARSSAR